MTLGGTECGNCGKNVLQVEQKQAGGKVFHTKCFKCVTCGIALTQDTVSDYDGDIFCTACFNYRCGWCFKSVPQEEEQLAAGKKWHMFCFVCDRCRKSLDSNTVAEVDGTGQIFCKTCYSIRSLPLKLGRGPGQRACRGCHRSVYTADELQTYFTIDSMSQFHAENKWANREVKVDSDTMADGGKCAIYCKSCLIGDSSA